MIEKKTYESYWQDTGITGLSLFVADSATTDGVMAAVRRLRVDDLHLRLPRRIQERLHQRIQSFQWWNDRLSQAPQTMGIEIYKEKVENLDYNLINNMNKFIDAMRTKVAVCQQGLRALDPQQVLNRGYSITRWQKNAQIIRDSQAVQIGDVIEILLAQGQLEAQVKKRSV